MDKTSVCRTCGTTLVERHGPGRRSRYCSVACRRAVEYARRRWDRRARWVGRHARSWDGRSAVVARIVRDIAADLREDAGPRP